MKRLLSSAHKNTCVNISFIYCGTVGYLVTLNLMRFFVKLKKCVYDTQNVRRQENCRKENSELGFLMMLYSDEAKLYTTVNDSCC